MNKNNYIVKYIVIMKYNYSNDFGHIADYKHTIIKELENKKHGDASFYNQIVNLWIGIESWGKWRWNLLNEIQKKKICNGYVGLGIENIISSVQTPLRHGETL